MSRRQALSRGMTRHAIEARLASGRWQTMYRAVYAIFSGEPGRLTWLWAATLVAGAGATLNHETAAELDGAIAHPGEARKRDRRRDNLSTRRGDRVLRYDLADVTEHPCATAEEVAGALALRGWKEGPRRCGPACSTRRAA